MLLPLILLSIPIVISDIGYRRIPNIYILVLSLCLIPTLFFCGFGKLTPLVFFLLTTFLMSFLGMGMGDLKLQAIIGIWLNIRGRSSLGYFAALILAISAIHIVWKTIKNRSIPKSIPMAPSIFLALSLYLASQ